jgi:glycerol-3-phosphate dehydrogenase (NAD+)
MWVFEEDYEGKPLSQVINETHENPRYLPGIKLGENVIAEPDVEKAVEQATALIFVMPHQFLRRSIKGLKGKVRSDAFFSYTTGCSLLGMFGLIQGSGCTWHAD